MSKAHSLGGFLTALIAYIVLHAGSVQASEPAAPVLRVGETRFIGTHHSDTNTNIFLGVPFAQPPVRDLRWQPPQPLLDRAETVQANQFAPACLQADRIVQWYKSLISDFGGDPQTFTAPEFSEDCLYLNIWAPAESSQRADKKMPVYVFIHGGSNKAGWAYEPNYIGEQLASSQGIIVVSIAYRLGALGFFAHPKLQHANFALLDQITALAWLKRHVTQIGGDPNNITVAGESAGADNIAVLLASPIAQNVFNKAVIQSGGWSINEMQTVQQGYEFSQRLAQELQIQHPDNLAALKNIGAERLIEAAEKAVGADGFQPLVGDLVLPRSLANVAEHQQLNSVDVIIGSNTNEYLIYLDPNQTVDSWLAEQPLSAKVNHSIKQILDDGLDQLQQVDKLITAAQFGCPALSLAREITANGNTAWVYDFNRVREGELAQAMGAYHGAELPYIFATHDQWLPTSTRDLQLTDAIQTYWKNFVHNGNPNSPALPLWPVFKQGDMNALSLGDQLGGIAHPSTALCSLLQTAPK